MIAAADNFRVIVVGASAGGVTPLLEIIRALDADLPAAVLVVVHTSPLATGVLHGLLDRAGRLRAAQAEDGEPLEAGRVYVAPPDYHLLVEPGRVRLSYGPRENNFRPAVDPLFRSAAAAYGRRVIAVILSGGRDDGTHGMQAVKKAGGITMVQDPQQAEVPGMPGSAMEGVDVDHVLPAGAIGPTLNKVSRESEPQPDREQAVRMETSVAESGVPEGEPALITCPECGGTLSVKQEDGLIRFECHVGHAFTVDALSLAHNGRVENALWAAVRALEESATIAESMSVRAQMLGQRGVARTYEQRAADAGRRADLVRSVLGAPRSGAAGRATRRAQATNGKNAPAKPKRGAKAVRRGPENAAGSTRKRSAAVRAARRARGVPKTR